MKKIQIVIAALTIVAVVLSVASCSVTRKKIDLKDYVSVEYTSFNGHAGAVLNINNEKLEEDIGVENLKKYFAKLNPDEARFYNSFGDYPEPSEIFTIQLKEKYENLSNGDAVVVEVVPGSLMEEKGQKISDCEKGLGINFKKTSVEFKVEGLEDAIEIDIFKDITKCINFSGADGYAKGEVNIPDDFSTESNGIYFSAYNSNSLQAVYNNQSVGIFTLRIKNADETKTAFGNGDIAVVYIDESNSDYSNLEKMCKAVLKSKTANIKIEGLGKLVTNKSELNSAVLEEIKSANMSDSSTILGIYAGTAKPSTALYNDSPFRIVVLQKTQRIFSSGYEAIVYYDIIQNSDGSWTCNGRDSTDSWSDTLWTFDEANPTASFDNGYDYEKIV